MLAGSKSDTDSFVSGEVEESGEGVVERRNHQVLGARTTF